MSALADTHRPSDAHRRSGTDRCPSDRRPRADERGPSWRAFHTPVRGHRFAVQPLGGAPIESARLRLRAEPDNPADPYAVAVWAEGGGRPWRVGYLERAVAVRVVARARDVGTASVRFAGWWEEPGGRWRRPVVRVAPPGGDDDRSPVVVGLRALPPCSTRRRGRVSGDRSPPP